MPDAPDTDLAKIEEQAKAKITEFTGDDEFKSEQEPVAFGLKALKLTFVSDEDKGSTDDVEAKIAEIEGVNSVEAVDVRRAMG